MFQGRSRAQSEPAQRMAPGLMEDSPKKRRARFRTLSSLFEQDLSGTIFLGLIRDETRP